MSALTLVIPLYNEGKNIDALVSMLAQSKLVGNALREVILVNNGSSDETGEKIDLAKAIHPWLTPLHLPQNLNYGGGVYEGLTRATTEFVGYIPGDLQVSIADVESVWDALLQHRVAGGDTILCKGWRSTRHDPFNTRFVSRVYTVLGNLAVGLKVRDVNGLPKLFGRSLVGLLPEERFKTFVFDAQILSTARAHAWTLVEVPVTFHARREGVSSWSGKRLRTYITTFRQMLTLRRTLRSPRA